MYRVLCTLQRSSTYLSKGIQLDKFLELHGSFETGARYCINYTTTTSIRPSISLYDNITKYQEDKKYGSANKNSKVKYEKLPVRTKSSVAEKRRFLINMLLELKESREAVYGKLDSWVAWQKTFPLPLLKQSLIVLEKHQQWHRIIQVLKWILSKGQGGTMGTYEQLIRALDNDNNRAEEAHNIWQSKISHHLQSVSWRFCDLMISIYYCNNMLDRLIQLFKELESYDRRPPNKSIVRKIADAYEILGLYEEKDKLLAKYSHFPEDSYYKHKNKNTFKKKGLENVGKEEKHLQ